ncbi:MAG: YicC family protein [Candidatus Omnitrophica bacterium]|nr:YicC family protein [Candidatus Omnitrophota bacterium]
MIRSMTAFARVTAPFRGGAWVVEIRSVNHRYFEFSTRLPQHLIPLEGRIRDFVQQEIHRGKVMVAVSHETGNGRDKNVILNEETLQVYLRGVKALKKKFKVEGDVTIGDLIKLPGIFAVEPASEEIEKIWPKLKSVLKKVIDQAVRAKMVEGQKLSQDIRKRLEKIRKAVNRIEKEAAGQADKIYKKLTARLEQLLAQYERDEERLHREIAFLAERSDITEEVVRAKSHLELFQKRLSSDGEAGRELDFLCQEINREVNTMTSKAQLFEVSTAVVSIKGELEKIREQVQNIE